MTLKIPTLSIRSAMLEVRTDGLPNGICGRVTGIALRYNVKDAYGTVFLDGALDKTRAKVAGMKVKFFDNHGALDSYGTRTHVGTVVKLERAGDAEVLTVDLFDTEDGRRVKEYLVAVTSSGAETGLSIGFYERQGEAVFDNAGNWLHYAFSEIELDEISLAPRQAVPGAIVTGVRNEKRQHAGLRALLHTLAAVHGSDTLLALLREGDTSATDGDEPKTDDGSTSTTDTNTAPETAAGDEPTDERSAPAGIATMEERIAALRESYHTP